MNTQFQNKFGSVTFRPASAVKDIRDIHGKDIDAALMFDIATAEKIALITENRRTQICGFNTANGWRCFIVLHESASTAAVAEIESLTYAGGDPAAELHNARQDVAA